MTSYSFKICQYNMGWSLEDYIENYNMRESASENSEFIKAEYAKDEQATALNLFGKADVYCLQEVRSAQRPLVKKLQQEEFEIISSHRSALKDDCDAVIALNKKRFSQICPIYCLDSGMAMATAIDTHTQACILFASAHVPGFSLEKVIGNGKGIPRSPVLVNKNAALKGDTFCKSLVLLINSFADDCAIRIIGADMNVNPEIYQARFNIFSNFYTLRTSDVTNLNSNSVNYKKRELDFIFFGENVGIHRFFSKMTSLFFKTTEHRVTMEKAFIGWEQHASDHRPIFVTVTTGTSSPQALRLGVFLVLFISLLGLFFFRQLQPR